ncbi:MAG: ATP-dependent Clp protease ATP-binding subunit [Deltaproteobacteria bacterium]|nr:ATP-dependent Clp protease ATP-binding subunit [Deltaproteobacteria bacterium]
MTVVPPEIAGRLDPFARHALAEALAQAELGQQGEITPLHVLTALLPACDELRAAVERRAVDPRLLTSFAEVTLARRKRGPAGLRPILDERLVARLSLAAAAPGGLLTPAALAVAALRCGSPEVERVLSEFDLRSSELAAAVESAGASPRPASYRAAAAVPAGVPPAVRERGATTAAYPAVPRAAAAPAAPPPGSVPALETGGAPPPGPWTVSLRAAAGRAPIVGRAVEISSVLSVLRQRTVRCAFVAGPSGCGRRTVLAEVLARLADAAGAASGPAAGLPSTAAALDLVSLLAGTRARGDLEDRLTKLEDALRSDADGILLCIPDASMLENATSGVGLDEILADLAERHGLRMAMLGTPDDAQRLKDKARRLLAAFEAVPIPEPSSDDLAAILAVQGDILARHHGLEIRPDARDAARTLGKRYLHEPAMPARAIHLLDSTAARAASAGRPAIDGDDVAETVGSWTHIPVARLMRGEAERLRALEGTLGKSIKGQDDAVCRVTRAVRRGRLGLRDPRRPIGSFLFAGPTGVGKTELARKLAEALFDDPQSLIRLDMSEFREAHMVARLLGAPPGYKDSEEGGVLTEAIKRRPYSVLLLDEMEKAHGDVHNILLQLLEDGRLSDARGRLFDFTHCVVVMTTNVGGMLALRAGPGEDLEEPMREALLGSYRPELLNRIDEIVIFRSLSDDALRAIARLSLDEASGLARPLGVEVSFTPAVDAWVVSRRDPPEFGARPVRRVVRREVLDRLAQMLLGGDAKAGDRVAFDADGGELRVRIEAPAPPLAAPATPDRGSVAT